MLTIIEQVIKDNNVRYAHIMSANSNSTQQKRHLIQPFESNGTLEKWQKGISKPFLLSNISPRGVSPPSYKITCSIVRNAWFILLFAQASIKIRNNTIKPQVVILSINFVYPRALWLVWGTLPGRRVWEDLVWLDSRDFTVEFFPLQNDITITVPCLIGGGWG